MFYKICYNKLYKKTTLGNLALKFFEIFIEGGVVFCCPSILVVVPLGVRYVLLVYFGALSWRFLL